MKKWCKAQTLCQSAYRSTFVSSDEIEPDQENVSKGIRQTLNHWALEPTTSHLNQYRDEKGHNVANEAADL